VLFIVGFVLAGFANADLVDVTNRLWRDDAVRAALVAQAERAAATPGGVGKLTEQTRKEYERTGDILGSIKQFNLPVWWNEANGRPSDLALAPKKGEESAAAWLLGVLLTAFALSFGAPFWFNVLSRLARFRGGGATASRE
jgi:hypothetical protein